MSNSTNSKEVLIVGTGYVGLVTAVGLAKLGHDVSCYDISEPKIAKLKLGELPFFEPGLSDLLSEAMSSGRITFCSDYDLAYRGQRYVIVAVPTPMNSDGDADLSILNTCVDLIAGSSTSEILLIIKSTVPVGVFDDINQRTSVATSLKKLQLVSCPEFLAEGSAVNDFFHPKRTIVGSESSSVNEEVAALFHGVGGKFISTDAKTAQMIKYSANSFLATRVAYINEIARLCQALGIDIKDVSEALLMDPRVGLGYLSSGVGFAGPCLPKDISALVATGKRVGVRVDMLNAVSLQNTYHLSRVIADIGSFTTPGDTVSVFGLSFKPNTDDVRNSFALEIISALVKDYGVEVRATDPRSIESGRSAFHGNNHVSFWLDPFEAARHTSLQVFLTPWAGYKHLDLPKLGDQVARRAIFDATGLFSPAAAAAIGFDYHGIGREFGQEGPATFVVTDVIPAATK